MSFVWCEGPIRVQADELMTENKHRSIGEKRYIYRQENTMTDYLEELIKNTMHRMTKGQKKIADFIINNPEEAAFLSSKDLGEKVDLSDASVIRLANVLGFSGFLEMKLMLQSWMKGKISPSEKLKLLTVGHKTEIYKTTFENNIQSILNAQSKIPISKFEQIRTTCSRAKRVFIIGLRGSFSVAFFLYYNLKRVMKNVFLIETTYGLQYDLLTDIGVRDVLFSISFPRYATKTVEVTRFAKERNAFIISITEEPLSPVGRLADISLCIRSAEPFLLGPPPTAFVIIECILNALLTKSPKKSIDKLKEFENSLERQGVWIE